MNTIKHIFQQPFVFATGMAALVHSTWALGTLFSGEQPTELAHFLGWLVPAFLIAFALDIGQIVTSADIREHGLTLARGITFLVFAAATYYLQWLYIAHHMPALELAAGVREQWSPFVQLVRDSALWAIPSLLPLSTLLYTFSGDHKKQVAPTMNEAPATFSTILVQADTTPESGMVLDAPANTPQLTEPLPMGFVAKCDACGTWEKIYDNEAAAARGVATHKQLHCKALHPVKVNEE